MIKIRLSRHGKKKNPVYRIVAIEHRRKDGGKALETFGHWHPSANELKVDKKGIEAWVKKGAQVSDAVKNLIK